MACDLCPPYSFMVRPRLQAVLPHDKVNLHCLEQRSREHMYPEVNKTLTGIHDSEVAPGLRPFVPQLWGPRFLSTLLATSSLESKHVLRLASPRLT